MQDFPIRSFFLGNIWDKEGKNCSHKQDNYAL